MDDGSGTAGRSSSTSSKKEDDDRRKKNTDCIYFLFLAYAFTCKKGIDCQYRHSEGARLNPRDCYFWWAGNCLNPTCAFRHVPMDGGLIPFWDPPVLLPHHPPPPLHGNNIPCYFFSNGYCYRGDKCSFLHGAPAHVSSPNSVEIAVELDAPLAAEDSSDDSQSPKQQQRSKKGKVEKEHVEHKESILVLGNDPMKYHGDSGSSDGRKLLVNDRDGIDIRDQLTRKCRRMDVHQTSPANPRRWDPSFWEEINDCSKRKWKQPSTACTLQLKFVSKDPYLSNKITSQESDVSTSPFTEGPKTIAHIKEKQRGES